jgi:hypothetical protein
MRLHVYKAHCQSHVIWQQLVGLVQLRLAEAVTATVWQISCIEPGVEQASAATHHLQDSRANTDRQPRQELNASQLCQHGGLANEMISKYNTAVTCEHHTLQNAGLTSQERLVISSCL